MPLPTPNTSPSGTVQGNRIPGYAQELWQPNGVVRQAIRLFLLYGSAILALDQLLIVQPKLYLTPLDSDYANGFQALGLGWFVIGILSSRFWVKPCRSPFFSSFLAAALVALSGTCRFYAFDGPIEFTILASAVAALALLSLGFTLHRVAPNARRLLRLRDGSLVYLHPFALAGFVFALVIATILGTTVGPMRASLAVGGGLAASTLLTLLDEPRRGLVRSAKWSVYGLFLALCVAAVRLESVCPLRRVLASSHPLIYTTQTSRVTVDVTVGQGGLHYFVNNELRFSSLDEERWAETLVLPAVMRVPHPKRALVLSLGEGLIERELLAADEELRITSVTRDRRLSESARRQPYLRKLTRDSLRSPRVTLFERDPAVFALKLNREQYDVIIVDLPDPAGPLEGKYYTHLFYEQLATHLDPAGVLVVQGTSARRSPRSFAVIGATLAAAGLQTTPVMVPLMTRGEWSLYLCTHGALPKVLDVERYRKSFPGSLEAQLMAPWPDTLPPRDFVATPSTLNNGLILDWFEYEAESTDHG